MCDFLVGWSWALIFWYAQGAIPILIAAGVAYIAYQQYRINYRQWETSKEQLETNKVKARLDLFERRYKIFEQLGSLLTIVTRDATVSPESLVKFRGATIEAYFLFGPEIEAYIEEMYRRGLKLRSANQRHDGDTWDAEIKWFSDQYDIIKPKLKKYLDVSKL